MMFVMLALGALVALPVVGSQYTGPHQAEIRELAEPGRTHVTHVQLALAVQGSVLHDYLENRDEVLVARYREAVERERAAYAALAPIATRLGGVVRQRFQELQTRQAEWHAAVEGFLARGNSGTAADNPLRHDLYEDMLLSAALLDAELSSSAHRSRARILAIERVQRRVTLALGIVAFVAVLTVAWLGSRLRAFADAAERRRVELERAMSSRARLMRGVSHDLKNPLNAIDGHAQLLEDELIGTLEPAQRNSVARIRNGVRSLLGLVNDLLELSRVEAGQLPMTPRPVEVAALLRGVAEEYRAAAEGVGLTLAVGAAAEDARIVTDPDRVRQVLGNLLSNAVKYTPPGGSIELRAVDQTAAERDGVALQVADTGSGIPADKLNAIFDEFARLDMHEHVPGVGLGLSIARRIAGMLGGELTVASEMGRGATFTLWLPRT